ncbi:hypothetical protein L1999_13600 [Neobacillus drentensis]|uniref:CBO0543 family protein n=1 Tax=Neobacillus drentensis TaxID=220684 RepID=UPI001F4252F6|nr:CBO0543 family protein [Neobacillus drentensis]ULT59489.1 hypothetical protein L1999_13600 [Neobacillus drentensis]
MKHPTFEDVKKVRETLRDVSINHWFHDDLFTWKWWLLLISATIPWLIWIRFRDKERTFEILSYGLIWATFASITDVIGGDMILWGYPDKLLPTVPPLLPADITVIPISYMFMYQYTKTFKTYLVFSFLLSGCFSYIIEPLFIKGQMFALHNWTHTYSFIGFFVLSQIVYFIIKKLTPI